MIKSTQAAAFPPTRWTLWVNHCRDGDGEAKLAAWEQLSQAYWYPLYAFARRLGLTRQDAEDMTQGFFCYALERDLVAGARQELGRLRTFMLAVFQRYIAGVRDKDRAVKRGGGVVPFSLDLDQGEERYQREGIDPASPEAIFDRSWAFAVLRATQEDLRDRETAAGRGTQFEMLEPFLTPDAVAERSYSTIAGLLEANEEAVRKMVSRLRKRYRDCLRERIAMTLASPSDDQIDEELLALRAALRS